MKDLISSCDMHVKLCLYREAAFDARGLPFSEQAHFQHVQFVTVFPRWSFALPRYTTVSVLFNSSSLPFQKAQRLFLFQSKKKKKTEERKKKRVNRHMNLLAHYWGQIPSILNWTPKFHCIGKVERIHPQMLASCLPLQHFLEGVIPQDHSKIVLLPSRKSCFDYLREVRAGAQ